MKSSGSMSSSPSSSGTAPMGAASPYTPQKWNKGDKLPAEFRDRQYVIDKYKEYNLPAPKKGYHWVGIGADYYQVSSNGTVYSVGPGG
ncbi:MULTISPECIES: RcnB family protein [Cupriavidus]